MVLIITETRTAKSNTATNIFGSALPVVTPIIAPANKRGIVTKTNL